MELVRSTKPIPVLLLPGTWTHDGFLRNHFYRSSLFLNDRPDNLLEVLYAGPYYDTQSLENLLKPGCMLAYQMNGVPLAPVDGAPLRLRVENQLGYKMVKWIERIEFIESEKQSDTARSSG